MGFVSVRVLHCFCLFNVVGSPTKSVFLFLVGREQSCAAVAVFIRSGFVCVFGSVIAFFGLFLFSSVIVAPRDYLLLHFTIFCIVPLPVQDLSLCFHHCFLFLFLSVRFKVYNKQLRCLKVVRGHRGALLAGVCVCVCVC